MSDTPAPLTHTPTPAHAGTEEVAHSAGVTRAPAILHVCVATEQVLANALPLRLLPWQKLVVVASEHLRNKHQARLLQLLRWAEAEAERQGLVPRDCISVEELNEKDMSWGDLLGFARRLGAELTLEPGVERIDLNLTGGTKLITQALSKAMGAQAREVYCNTAAEHIEVLDPQGLAPALPLPPDLLNLTDYLHAQGYELHGTQRADDATWRAGLEQRRALTVALVLEHGRLRAASHGRLLGQLHRMAADSLPVSSAPGRSARPFRPEAAGPAPRTDAWCEVVAQLLALKLAELVSWDGPQGRERLVLRWVDEAAARYAAGGYLEEYTALCLLALELPHAQWAANVRLRLRDGKLPEGQDHQELDLAVVWRNRLWVLECKAGQQLHTEGSAAQNTLNKLEAVKAHVGGSMGEGWLVMPMGGHETAQPGVQDRAKRYGLRLETGHKAMLRLPLTLSAALGVPLRDPSWLLGPGLPDLSAALDSAERLAAGALASSGAASGAAAPDAATERGGAGECATLPIELPGAPPADT